MFLSLPFDPLTYRHSLTTPISLFLFHQRMQDDDDNIANEAKHNSNTGPLEEELP
jgi:hypothetical protein